MGGSEREDDKEMPTERKKIVDAADDNDGDDDLVIAGGRGKCLEGYLVMEGWRIVPSLGGLILLRKGRIQNQRGKEEGGMRDGGGEYARRNFVKDRRDRESDRGILLSTLLQVPPHTLLVFTA